MRLAIGAQWLLFGMSTFDAVPYVAVSILFFLIALLTAYGSAPATN